MFKRFLSIVVLALFASSATAQIFNPGVVVFDEASQLGRARSLAFVGSTVSCGISGGLATCTFTAPSFTLTHNSTVTSGCTDYALVRSVLNLANCGAGLTYDGTTLRGPNGSAAAPGLAIGTGAYGIYRTSNTIGFVANTFTYFALDAAFAVNLSSGAYLAWKNSTDAAGGTVDAAFSRRASGVLQYGSTATNIKALLGGGTAVASATAMPLPTGRVFHVTGTTTITSITSTNFASGAVITLIFDDVLTFTDGSNLVLAGDFVTTANGTITLVYDGSSWFEISRSIN